MSAFKRLLALLPVIAAEDPKNCDYGEQRQ